MPNVTTVAKTTDIEPGAGKIVEANGREVAIFNVDGCFYAIDNVCIHKGGPLGDGSLEGEVVTCPWHGWRFNVKTGACLANPAAKVKAYAIKVENDEIKLVF